jgi:hypothetical protein
VYIIWWSGYHLEGNVDVVKDLEFWTGGSKEQVGALLGPTKSVSKWGCKVQLDAATFFYLVFPKGECLRNLSQGRGSTSRKQGFGPELFLPLIPIIF